MTSNTSPEKPEWFALIEKDAPSAQVRKVDKKLPVATGIMAIAIVALGTFFTNGSMSIDSSAANSMSPSTSANSVASTQVAGEIKTVKTAGAQSMDKIADPTLNGGGDDDEDEYGDDDDDDDEDEYEEDRD